MELSANFTLQELTVTQTGIPNKPGPQVINNLKLLVRNVLQPARFALGMPITVTSGYRSPAVNTAVGGSPTSDHPTGRAADITSADNTRLFSILRQMNFDQLIWCGSFIHVSFRTMGNRRQVMRKKNGKYLPL